MRPRRLSPRRAPGARFSLGLPALALLLGALLPAALLPAAPAEAQTTVSLSASDRGLVSEGHAFYVTATLSDSLANDVRIPLTFRNDTAEGGDYSPPRSYIPIYSGKKTGELRIQTNQDGDQDNETFTVALNTSRLPSGVSVGSPSSVQIRIHDDAASNNLEVHLWASPNPVPEGSPVTVRVLLSRGSQPTTASYSVTVPVRVERGTSEEGDHGTLESITIPAGDQNAAREIWTSRDTDAEDETFLVYVPLLPMDESLNYLTRGDPYSAWVTISENTGRTDGPPVPPTGLLITPGARQLALTWTAPAGTVTGYDVHYTASTIVADNAPVGSTETTARNAWVDAGHVGTTTTRTILNLSNTLYRVRVRAQNAEGYSAWATGQGTPRTPGGDNDGPTGGPTGGGPTGGGGGGGGSRTPDDRHGNTPDEATTLNPRATPPAPSRARSPPTSKVGVTWTILPSACPTPVSSPPRPPGRTPPGGCIRRKRTAIPCW